MLETEGGRQPSKELPLIAFNTHSDRSNELSRIKLTNGQLKKYVLIHDANYVAAACPITVFCNRKSLHL